MPERLELPDRTLFKTANALTTKERAEVPNATVELFERWRSRPELPNELSWSRELWPPRAILERCDFAGRVYWNVLLDSFNDVSHRALAGPKLRADGIARNAKALPTPLDWLARTFGSLSLVPETSGTAPFGWRVDAMRASGGFLFSDPDYDARLSPGSESWVALYELDGDAIAANLEDGTASWLGAEWTGDGVTGLRLPWESVLHVVLWRMLDGSFVRPSDLAMLAAARAAT